MPGSGSFRELSSQLRRRSSLVHREAPLREDEEAAAAGAKTIDQEMAEMPIWYSTLTLRALFAATILGAAFSIISLKLGLSTGIIPSLNIAAGLLGFFLVKGMNVLLAKMRIVGRPFTRQEATVVQTCVVACYGMAFNGGFGTYLLAMDQQSYENVGDIPGNRAQDVYQPSLTRTIPYMFSISLLGIFFLLPLRNLFILKYDLPYPSGEPPLFFPRCSLGRCILPRRAQQRSTRSLTF
jgi:uncharacterized oligopeptide transporter (OPT) family protein